MIFETGRLAAVSDGAATVRLGAYHLISVVNQLNLFIIHVDAGQTEVLCTAVSLREARFFADNVPLKILVNEKLTSSNSMPRTISR